MQCITAAIDAAVVDGDAWYLVDAFIPYIEGLLMHIKMLIYFYT